MADVALGGNVERQYSVVEIMTKVRQLRQKTWRPKSRPPPKRPRSVLSLVAAALVAGTIFSLVVESGVGLVGGWNIPQHSARVLGETAAHSRLANTDFVPGILSAIRTNLKWVAIIPLKSQRRQSVLSLSAPDTSRPC